MRCVKVKLIEAEKAKNELVRKGLVDAGYLMKREGNYFFIPVLKEVKGYDNVVKKLEKKVVFDFNKEISKILNKKELENFNSAYDIIGEIAIIEVAREMEGKGKEIADLFLKSNKKVKTVLKKVGAHSGEYRLQDYEYLAGEEKFDTVFKENGVALKLDVRKTYYSPRSSGERLRIAKQINKGENVLVLFSGVGVYGFVFSKHSKASRIVEVEINPDACKYAEESLKLNKNIKNVSLHCGDVREFFDNYQGEKFDRVVMPLPASASEFLDVVSKLIKKNGIIHFYFFDGEDVIKDNSKLEKLFSKYFERFKILKIVKAGQKSPRVFRLCSDILVG